MTKGTRSPSKPPELQKASSGLCKRNRPRAQSVSDPRKVPIRQRRSQRSLDVVLDKPLPPEEPVVVEKYRLAQSSKDIDLDRSNCAQVKTAVVQEKENLESHVEGDHDGREAGREETSTFDVYSSNYFMATGRVKVKGAAAPNA